MNTSQPLEDTGPRGAILSAFVLAFFYWGAVQIGLLFFIEKVSIFWPANGIALAFFLTTPKKNWPLFMIAMAVGYFAGLINVDAQPLGVKVGFLAANYIEILPTAWLICRAFSRGVILKSFKGLFYFLGLGAIVGPAVGSFVATLVVVFGFDTGFSFAVWIGWGVGNAVSTMMIALPTYFIIQVLTAPDAHIWFKNDRTNAFEFAGLFIITMLILGLIYNFSPSEDFNDSTAFILFPLAVIAALRFDLEACSLWLFIVVFYSAFFTAQGVGPFIEDGADFQGSILHLHSFSISLCIVSAITAGLIADQRNHRKNTL